jgi:hypothetical protein
MRSQGCQRRALVSFFSTSASATATLIRRRARWLGAHQPSIRTRLDEMSRDYWWTETAAFATLLSASVSDPEVHREDLVGRKSDLPAWELGPAAGRCLPYGVPQLVERRFSLCHQLSDAADVLLRALLHQASPRLARRLRPASYFHRKHCAAVEVRPDAVGQVCVTPSAPVCADAERIRRGDLL